MTARREPGSFVYRYQSSLICAWLWFLVRLKPESITFFITFTRHSAALHAGLLSACALRHSNRSFRDSEFVSPSGFGYLGRIAALCIRKVQAI